MRRTLGDVRGLELGLTLKTVDDRRLHEDCFPLNLFSFRHGSSLPLSRCPEMKKLDSRDFRQEIDINKTPCTTDCYEEETRVSSPNSTVSSISAGKRDVSGEETERTSCSRGSDEEDGASRKKLRLSKEQSLLLEETFKEQNTLNPRQKLALAKQLNLRPRQVEVWFQNRRARTKLKQTEVDCEYLKRCCENLTEENMRLQKEVHELRALKLLPQMYTHMNPPTTLTMCPSCERVAISSSSPAATTAASGRRCPPHNHDF